MAMEIPIIAADVAGVREVVRHGETGYLFSPNDSLALSELIRLFCSDQVDLEKMRGNQQRLISDKFDRRRSLNRLLIFLKELSRDAQQH